MKNPGLVSLDNVIELIKLKTFGWFILTNLSGNEVYAGSHLDITKSSNTSEIPNISTDEIIKQVTDTVTFYGEGAYKLQLKRAYSVQSKDATVTYRFFYGDQEPAGTSRNQNFQQLGYSPDMISNQINQAVAAAVNHQQEKFQLQMEIFKLQNQLLEEKRKRKSSNDSENIPIALKGLLGLGLAIASKVTPTAMPGINALLQEHLGVELEETEEEEEKPQPLID